MHRGFGVVGFVVLVASACGSDGGGSDPFAAQPSSSVAGGITTASSSPAPPAAPVGPADENTIQVGSDVWDRTLPMVTGQCFLQEADGVLERAATAWGSLDGGTDLTFSATLQGDVVEADVKNNADIYWLSGERSPSGDDLVIELDFANQTIRGSGTFTSLLTNESVGGSFEFHCEE